MRYFIFFIISSLFTTCKEKCKISGEALKIYPLNKDSWQLQTRSNNSTEYKELFAKFIFEGDFCDKQDSITKYLLTFIDTTGNKLFDSTKLVSYFSLEFFSTTLDLNKNSKMDDRDLSKYHYLDRVAYVFFEANTKTGEIRFERNGADYAHVDISKKNNWELGKVEYY